MKKLTLLTVVLAALLLIVGAVAAHPTNFRAHLAAAVEGQNIRGQGQANFQLDHGELRFIMPVSRLKGETLAAHIHYSAEPGGNGPPVISLCGAFGPPPIPTAECGGPGHPAKGSIWLDSDQVDQLMEMIAQNRAYVNVHTTAFGGGEVRGQIVISP